MSKGKFRAGARGTCLSTHVKGLTRNSMVFSSWRMSLDLVEAGLQREGIGYLRFDGKLPQKQRKPVIDEFKRNPRIRVFLLTLSCGAVGYVSAVALLRTSH